MPRYEVAIWIDDIEVQADTADEAIEKACDMVINGEVKISVDYAEARKEFKDGAWKYV